MGFQVIYSLFGILRLRLKCEGFVVNPLKGLRQSGHTPTHKPVWIWDAKFHMTSVC